MSFPRQKIEVEGSYDTPKKSSEIKSPEKVFETPKKNPETENVNDELIKRLKKIKYVMLFISLIIILFWLTYIWWPSHKKYNLIYKIGMSGLVLILFFVVIYFTFW